jgi:glycosyltransferase involved in cell wall biosynthesis
MCSVHGCSDRRDVKEPRRSAARDHEILRALHIVAGLDPRHGGPSYSVPRLCAALREVGAEAHILTVREPDTPRDPFIAAHAQDLAGMPFFRALRLSSGLARAARRAARVSDIVHVHGLWLMPNVSAGRTAAAAGRPLIVSPRGMLSGEALAFSTRRKRLFWNCLQGPAYANAAVWHATSAAEAEDIRAFGVRAPIAIVPNGIDLPQGEAPASPHEGGLRTILYLGRIQPIKGLPDLIAAWGRLAGKRPDWALRIVGPDECEHRAELEALVARVGALRTGFDGPMYGAEKQHLLHEADLFVLPTRNENFGLAVAEALAAGVPAIVSRGAPWSGLETERCGWWIDHGADSLASTLERAMSLTKVELCAMGARGRAWMASEFSWGVAARKMTAVYAWAARGAERPDFIYLD